jgi:hypothetical protein
LAGEGNTKQSSFLKLPPRGREDSDSDPNLFRRVASPNGNKLKNSTPPMFRTMQKALYKEEEVDSVLPKRFLQKSPPD